MQILDRTGVGTLWSICKTKFALAGHTHNYAGSGSAGGSANSAISVVDYGQTSKTIQIGYAGSGITGEQIKYIAGYTTGSGDVSAKIKDVSKDALRSWLGLGTLAYSSATITDNKVTQNAVKSSDYTNWRSLVFSAANSATEGFAPSTTTDGVFIANTLSVQPSSGTIKANKFKGALEGNASTASSASTVNGYTVNANVPSNAKFTDTNTWRGIQDNLTSSSTSDSLSANQGRVLKGLVDGKANSSHTHSWSQISGAPATATRWPSWGEVTGKPGSFTPSSHTHDWSQVTGKPELKNWSDTKSYIDNKFSLSSGVKRIINIDFISTRAPELIYDHTDNNFRLCDAIRDWNGGTIFCTVYKKKIYYGFTYMYNHDSNHPQWIKNAFSDKSYKTIDPRGEFYHGVVDSDTILNLHGTFYNADLQQCDSNGNVLA